MTNSVKPLKLIHLAPGDLWAGAEAQLFHLVSSLSSADDVDVMVILLNTGTLYDRLIGAGIEVMVLDESRLSSLTIFTRLRQIFRSYRPGLIHTHRHKLHILASLAARTSCDSLCIRTAHGSQEHPPSWLQLRKRLILSTDWFCARFLQHAIVSVTNDLADILQKDFPAHHIHTIENGIDIDAVRIRKSATEENTGDVRVGVVGRLVPIKRIDLFIETATRYLERSGEQLVSFHIYGDGPLMGEISQQLSTSSSAEAIHLEGHVEDIYPALDSLDILMMPSDHEGLPMTLLEAMALEVPIIAHRTGGLTELLDGGDCARLVEDHTAGGYLEALTELIESPERRDVISENALSRLRDRYSLERQRDQYIELYRSLIRDLR